ncbi:MAG: hypothetical protein ACU0B7_14350 [Paracoccaceae bacterium]
MRRNDRIRTLGSGQQDQGQERHKNEKQALDEVGDRNRKKHNRRRNIPAVAARRNAGRNDREAPQPLESCPQRLTQITVSASSRPRTGGFCMSGSEMARFLHQCAQDSLIESNCGNFVRKLETKLCLQP